MARDKGARASELTEGEALYAQVDCSWSVCCGALVLLAIQPGAQETQGLTPREEELLRYIQSLEERLTELEAIVKQGMEQKSPPPTVEPAPELEARVEQLETKLEQTEQAQPGDMRVFWRDGLRMQTADGAFEMRLGAG